MRGRNYSLCGSFENMRRFWFTASPNPQEKWPVVHTQQTAITGGLEVTHKKEDRNSSNANRNPPPYRGMISVKSE